MCQSRCKTCDIWRLYKEHPARIGDELTLDEIETIFAGMGDIYFFNISGGEPFLRHDLPDIVRVACRHLHPRVIHVPTNALAPTVIEKQVTRILEMLGTSGLFTSLTIKPSFDGVGHIHDEIRGVPGNFEKVMDTLSRLKSLKTRYASLEVGLGTIISKYNLGHIRETAQFVRELGVDSYISEIAEERTELFNVGRPITPSAEEYEVAISTFKGELSQPLVLSHKVSAVTLAFRQVYYDYAVRILREQRQVLPCYAGLANVHLSPYGDVWPCCVLGYAKSMGNLRDHDYDFYKIWRSAEADDVRRDIAEGKCHCLLANQAYSNILCSPAAMLRVLRRRQTLKSARR
jgi:MoaA/NifB/PqqE/SkfB family radical SAM enzyme